MDWMCCFSSCKPRYARLAESIYPRSLNEGLVTANMQKLTFYAISHPEKLDRIGTVLVNQLAKDLARQRFTQVKISVDAMDQLLQSCHGSPSLNQFTENFLRMVQKLLETNLAPMEKLATDSFVNFANIQEETPSYHRQYDFFISKFSAMCHMSKPRETATQVRYQGLRGLRGVVWKSVTDDLHANIWEKQHMDKIVPSILINFYDDFDGEEQKEEPSLEEIASANVEQSPKQLADQCLRELMGKASFGSLRSVMEPVLKHCDLHQKWNNPPNFAIATFRAILYSIPTQISNFVIQVLINHLDTMSASEAEIRIGIATVLSSIVSIAGTSIGPLLLDIFNSLLKHLRASVEYQQSRACPSVDQERRYQETLINAMADFANALPDYQKVEIMMFTVGNIPKVADDDRAMKSSDSFLQHVLVKTLLKIATKYKTAYLATMFTDSFLNTLLDLALVSDPQVRYTTQQIFHTLFDRHDNLNVLEHLPFIGELGDLLTVEKCTRADQMFMRRHITHISSVLYRCVCLIEEDEHLQNNMDAVLCTMALMCIEVGYDETLIELFRLAFGLQSMALDNKEAFPCGLLKKAAIHNLVARYLNLSCQLLAIPSLCNHVQQVISNRTQKAHPLLHFNEKGLPKQTTLSDGAPSALEIDDDLALQFDKSDLSEALKASGKDVQHLSVPFKVPLGSPNTTGGAPNKSALSAAIFDLTDSFDVSRNSVKEASADDISLDLSIDWSPPGSRRTSRRNTIFNPEGSDLMIPTTVAMLRQMVNAPPDVNEEIRKDQDQSLKIVSMFRDDPDAAFSACVKKDLEDDQNGDLSSSIQRLIQRNMNSAQMSSCTHKTKPKNVFELKLPESFVF
ncbi:hypothetical protein L596_018054 [Steinernema carpocapsae]|uniref:Uncharacterized protein n=1 Tax=Steinernema carpocapsae TaxID=34508 RepID=A0A4U5N3R6_STECR|nr:hypothetical protein L596_018054 [Steinernema carpocapsae]